MNGLNDKIKCLVWDLDNTLWDDILIENNNVNLKNASRSLVELAERKGIINSIASKNDYGLAMKKLQEFGIQEYFVYPQISWNDKSKMIEEICDSLRILPEHIVFIDDQEYECQEVKNAFTNINTILIDDIDILNNKIESKPEEMIINRKTMYQDEVERIKYEKVFNGSRLSFLKSLNMKICVRSATEKDLDRCLQLINRTNQLNATGANITEDLLKYYYESSEFDVLVGEFNDKFGEYGIIGVFIIKRGDNEHKIVHLNVSCRVLNRGIGTIIISHLCNSLWEKGVNVSIDFAHSEYNKAMFMSFLCMGFKKVSNDGVISNLVLDKHIEIHDDYYDIEITRI